MRSIAVTVETVPVASSLHCFRRSSGTVTEERLMAPEAVFLNHAFPGFPDINGLRFVAQGKDCSMPEAVICLEIVFPDEAVMRHMACIAVGNTLVRAVRPGGELRGHDVAVDAYPGIIREIGSGIRYLQKIKRQTCECSKEHYDRQSPLWRRREESDQFVWSAHGSGLFIRSIIDRNLLPGMPEGSDEINEAERHKGSPVPLVDCQRLPEDAWFSQVIL